MELIRQTTNDLIKQCKEMVDEEEMNAAAAASAAGGEYLNKGEQSGSSWVVTACCTKPESCQLRIACTQKYEGLISRTTPQ